MSLTCRAFSETKNNMSINVYAVKTTANACFLLQLVGKAYERLSINQLVTSKGFPLTNQNARNLVKALSLRNCLGSHYNSLSSHPRLTHFRRASGERKGRS